MKIPAPVTNAYNHASAGLDNAKKSAEVKYAQFSETKAGKRVHSFVDFVKKVCNVPVQFVRNHPKATIAVGMITMLVGGITANPPAATIGATLLVSGLMAQLANRHDAMKAAMQQQPQPVMPEASLSFDKA